MRVLLDEHLPHRLRQLFIDPKIVGRVEFAKPDTLGFSQYSLRSNPI